MFILAGGEVTDPGGFYQLTHTPGPGSKSIGRVSSYGGMQVAGSLVLDFILWCKFGQMQGL